MSSLSQAAAARMDSLDSQIMAAETRLSNLNSEIAAVSSRRSAFRQEVEAETKRLLEQRSKELDVIALKAQSELLPVRMAIGMAQSELDTLKQQTRDKVTELEMRSREVRDIQIQLSEARNSLQTLENDIDSRREASVALLDSADAAMSRKNALAAAIKEGLDRQEALVAENMQLREESKRQRDEFAAQEENHTRKVHDLELREANLKDAIRQAESEQELIRKDIATRLRAMDERDHNLKVREHKVAKGEETMQRNAELLDL